MWHLISVSVKKTVGILTLRPVVTNMLAVSVIYSSLAQPLRINLITIDFLASVLSCTKTRLLSLDYQENAQMLADPFPREREGSGYEVTACTTVFYLFQFLCVYMYVCVCVCS